MRNWNISTKIVVYICGAMALLLFLSGFVSLRIERARERAFDTEYREKLEQTIREREDAEKRSLQHHTHFTTKTLSRIGAVHLFHLDLDGMKEALRSYIEYPEILAIQVWDEKGQPFAAIWKAPEITEEDELPQGIGLDAMRSVQEEALQDGLLVGKFQVFFTDELLQKHITAARGNVRREIEAFEATSQSRMRQTMLKEVTGSGFILLALVICQIVFLRVFIFKPLLTVSDIADKLAHLDLMVHLDTTKRDEVGQMFLAVNGMIQSFKQVISQVQRSGIQVTSSSTELAATAKQQEMTMRTQMDSIHQTVQAIQDISDVMVELDNTVQKVVEMSGETAEFASSGQTDLSRMEEAMTHMEQASQSISGRLEAINEKAENITTVVTTITKVADQTNLLSLNASIEAEKAGEYGRGFTVVAREIRRLADQTAVATLDIEQMVQEMQSAVSVGVMEMDKFIAEVRQSAEDVEKISIQLTRIIEQVQALSPRFEDVNEAMQFQSQNAHRINETIVRLSEEMQQTTESLRESFLAIEQLNEAARGLQEEVSRFKVEE